MVGQLTWRRKDLHMPEKFYSFQIFSYPKLECNGGIQQNFMTELFTSKMCFGFIK